MHTTKLYIPPNRVDLRVSTLLAAVPQWFHPPTEWWRTAVKSLSSARPAAAAAAVDKASTSAPHQHPNRVVLPLAAMKSTTKYLSDVELRQCWAPLINFFLKEKWPKNINKKFANFFFFVEGGVKLIFLYVDIISFLCFFFETSPLGVI